MAAKKNSPKAERVELTQDDARACITLLQRANIQIAEMQAVAALLNKLNQIAHGVNEAEE